MGGSSLTPTLGGKKKTLNYKFWLNVEVTLLSMLIIAVWSMMSLPIIFYHLPTPEEISNTIGITNSDADSMCSAPLQYATASGTCLTYLTNILESSNCPFDPEGNVLVVRNEEARAKQLIDGLKLIGASAECISKAVPFLCLYVFGLCGGSKVSIQPTTSQCEELRDTLCQREWVIVQRLGIDLPDCAMLPAEAPSCPALNSSLSTNEIVMRNSSVEHPIFPNGTQECREGFYRENGSSVCTPSCHTWLQYDEGLSIFIDVVVFMAAFIGVLSAIAVIFISFLRRKRMLSYPSIFIVYQVSDLLVLGIFVIVNYMDRNGLSCSSQSLVESLREVTPFCVMSGILFTYVLCQLALWWLFHTLSLLWKVVFPLHARSFETSGKVKCIHITCIILGIILPLFPIIASMADFAMDIQKQNENTTSQFKKDLFLSGGLGFRSSRFPAILCNGGDRDVIFYSVVLPIDIILASGSTILIIIFWSIHRQNVKLKAEGTSNPFKFGTAEKKLLIVFCYYVVLAVVSLTSFTLATRNGPQFVRNVQRYFFCEQGGHNPSNPCNRSDFEKLLHPSVTTIGYALLASYPVVNLVYAVNVQELKEMWKKWFTFKQSIFSDAPSTGSSFAMTSTLKRAD